MAVTVKGAFVDLVLSDSTITGLIGRRLFPGEVPEGKDLPAAAYQVIPGAGPEYTQEGESALNVTRMQLSIVGKDELEAVTVAEAFRKKLSGYKGVISGFWFQGIFVQSDYDGTTNLATKVHTLRQDYELNWSKRDE